MFKAMQINPFFPTKLYYDPHLQNTHENTKKDAF